MLASPISTSLIQVFWNQNMKDDAARYFFFQFGGRLAFCYLDLLDFTQILFNLLSC